MGRSPTKVVVSAQTVVELAKCAVVTIRCETPSIIVPPKGGAAGGAATTIICGQELSSWKMFLKHQLKKHSSRRKGVYLCGLNKCSAKSHESLDSLKMHVEASHMKNVALPCPFANCKPHIPQFGRPTPYNMFLKEKDLVAHLQLHHYDLIGCELDLRSELLLPSWEPRPPIRPLPAPPDLPSGKIPMAAFRVEELSPRRIRSTAWIARRDAEGTTSSSSIFAPSPPPTPTPSLIPPTSTPKTPAGRRTLLRTPSVLSTLSPERELEPQYDFAELPTVYYDSESQNMLPAGIIGPPYFVVQRAGGEFSDRADLVRALPMPQAPMPEKPPPPTSIFYETLRQQVLVSYALGEDAATDVPLPDD